MKRLFVLTLILILAGLCCQSCRNFMFSHNPIMITSGKYFNLGIDGYGLTFANGTVVVGALRENGELKVKAKDGDKFEGAGANAKGICVIRYRTGPQVTGYLKDIASKDSETAKKYMEIMPDLNNSVGKSKDKDNNKGENNNGKQDK